MRMRVGVEGERRSCKSIRNITEKALVIASMLLGRLGAIKARGDAGGKVENIGTEGTWLSCTLPPGCSATERTQRWLHMLAVTACFLRRMCPALTCDSCPASRPCLFHPLHSRHWCCLRQHVWSTSNSVTSVLLGFPVVFSATSYVPRFLLSLGALRVACSRPGQ
jgi:hypothetical protein